MQFRPRNAYERMVLACIQLHETTQDAAAWEWDNKFAAALLVVEPPHDGAVWTSLTELLPHSWSQLDIDTAPERVRDASGVWGGLIAGQVLFALDPADDPMLFAAWWPWANGLRFSLRVSCTARGEAVARTDPQAKLRASFGL